MKTRWVLRTALALVCATALVAGCSDNTGPGGGGGGGGGGDGGGDGGGGSGVPANGLHLAIAVRVNPATFPGNGEFDLELIPSDSLGNVLVSEPWTIDPSITAPTGNSISLLSHSISTPDTRPFAIAFDLDNSSSMAVSDPDRLRVTAAQILWNTLFEQTPGSKVSLLYFGLKDQPPSPGFIHTRILQDWTSDTTQLKGKLDTLQTQFGSPLYSSLLEAANWVDTTQSATEFQRALMVLTDGEPSDTAKRDDLLAAAAASGMPIYAVGLGPAASAGSQSKPAAVAKLQELANLTGGIYASAPTPEQLSPVLQSLVVSSTTGALIAHVKISPVPPAGTAISGSVKLTHPLRGSVSGPWTFTSP